MKGDGVEKARRASSPIRFGIFEADLASGELRKHGEKIKLQDQPFQVLAALLERPGELVTRDEIQPSSKHYLGGATVSLPKSKRAFVPSLSFRSITFPGTRT